MPPYTFDRLPDLGCRPHPDAPRYIVERSNQQAPLYTFRFTVVGRGDFPVDMLRRDQCYPRDPTSAAYIVDDGDKSLLGAREVHLQAENRAAYWLPTFERWRSFGWVVKTDVED